MASTATTSLLCLRGRPAGSSPSSSLSTAVMDQKPTHLASEFQTSPRMHLAISRGVSDRGGDEVSVACPSCMSSVARCIVYPCARIYSLFQLQLVRIELTVIGQPKKPKNFKNFNKSLVSKPNSMEPPGCACIVCLDSDPPPIQSGYTQASACPTRGRLPNSGVPSDLIATD